MKRQAKTPAGLTAKQSIFVGEYLVSGNATQAAIKAGYSARTAREQGSRQLTNVHIRKELEKREKRRADRLNLSADFVLNRILEVAEEAQGKGEFAASLKGYELLGKHLKLFTDRTELTGKDGNSLEVTVYRVGD